MEAHSIRSKLIAVKPICLLLVMAGLVARPSAAQTPLAGRWDLTIKTSTDSYPSWMEFSSAKGAPQVRLVGRVASVHPAENLKVNGSHVSFTTSEWFGKTIQVAWDLSLNGDRLEGTQKRQDGVTGRLTGVRATALDRHVSAWGNPEPLFDGKDTNGWEPLITEPGKPVESHWVAQKGELVNTAPGANIRTGRTFQDFKLHVEYNCPKDGNSGVYLRGRYEVQVEYEPPDKNDAQHGMGSIYGFLAPAAKVPLRPGQWESYDITLVGRHVTIVRDGVTTIDNREIPGITGGALDSQEGQPGPIYIQGDHTGGMKYRNITITLPHT
jgi:hypothetical protein